MLELSFPCHSMPLKLCLRGGCGGGGGHWQAGAAPEAEETAPGHKLLRSRRDSALTCGLCVPVQGLSICQTWSK